MRFEEALEIYEWVRDAWPQQKLPEELHDLWFAAVKDLDYEAACDSLRRKLASQQVSPPRDPASFRALLGGRESAAAPGRCSLCMDGWVLVWRTTEGDLYGDEIRERVPVKVVAYRCDHERLPKLGSDDIGYVRDMDYDAAVRATCS